MTAEQQLQNLIAELAKNTRALETLQARNPEREFVYREGNVGAKKDFGPCEKIENLSLQALKFDSVGRYTFAATLNVNFWEFDFTGSMATGALPSTSAPFTTALQFEFDTALNFSNPDLFYAPYEIGAIPYSFTANTGTVYYRFNRRIPIRKRFCRVSCGVQGFQSDSYVFRQYPFSSVMTTYMAPFVAAFGE